MQWGGGGGGGGGGGTNVHFENKHWETSAPKISSGGGGGAGGGNVRIAFSTGGQMSINRFSNWGVNVLGAYVLESGNTQPAITFTE